MGMASHISFHTPSPSCRSLHPTTIPNPYSTRFDAFNPLRSPSSSRKSITSSSLRCNVLIAPKTRRNHCIKAGASAEAEGIEKKPHQTVKKPSSVLSIAYRVIRPYSLIGTGIGFMSVIARSFLENHHLISQTTWVQVSFKAFVLMVATLSINCYANIINQIFDLEIDKINKPHLPIASGELPIPVAWSVNVAIVASGVAFALYFKSKAFLTFLLLQIVTVTMYSVPPFYTKRSTYGAIVTCSLMRGLFFHLAACAAGSASLGIPFHLSPALIYIVALTTVFSLAVGILKDLPDVEGDRANKVPTLAALYGPELAAVVGVGLMLLCNFGSVAAGFLYPQFFRLNLILPAHLSIASYVLFRALKLHKCNYEKEKSQEFYMFMWNVLNVECIIFPFI